MCSENTNLIKCLNKEGYTMFSTKSEELLNKIDEKNKYELEIDSILREDKTALTQAIIAKLFNEYKKEMDKTNSNKLYEFESKKELIRYFSRVVDSIKYIEKDIKKIIEENEDNIDMLMWLSEASRIKENIGELIKKYLEIIEGKELLVITITEEINKGIEKEIKQYWGCERTLILYVKKKENKEGDKDKK